MNRYQCTSGNLCNHVPDFRCHSCAFKDAPRRPVEPKEKPVPTNLFDFDSADNGGAA